MTTPSWIGVQVSMQSAIATAVNVTAITKASPGVASATAHGYANGDYYLNLAQGMTQVNNRVFRAAGVAANTFQLEGEDTTLYDTFSSGTAQKITFGNSFSTLSNISGSGGDFDQIDTTTIHANEKTSEPGLASALVFTFDSYWDLADAGLQAAIAASKTKSKRAFLFAFPGGQKMAFYGTVGASGIPGGSSGQKVTTKLTITATGVPTYYTS